MPLVRKTKYHQKKKRIKELESELKNSKSTSKVKSSQEQKEELEQKIAQFQNQINQLNALQKENPTPARTLTVKELAKKQYNSQSLLNGIKKAERERERESNLSPSYPNFLRKIKFLSLARIMKIVPPQ